MTVIACRDGVMASDSGVFHGDYHFVTQQKIFRAPDGSLYACSGPAAPAAAVSRWFALGRPEDFSWPAVAHEDGFGVIWLRQDGIWLIDEAFVPFPDDGMPFAADGSHSDFLFGAMAQGASAVEAVELAIKYGVWARGPAQVERL